jgi:Ca-activated chloride channel homolog
MSMPPPPRRRRRLSPRLLFLLAAALLLAGGASPAAAKASKAEREKQATAIAALSEKYRNWLSEVEVLISDEEREAFLALDKDYQRDAFIERFWRARDPYPDTARNEFRDRYEERVAQVRSQYGSLDSEQAHMFLIHGEPAGVRKVECGTLLWPTEIWYYAGSDVLHFDFFLVWVQRWHAGPYRLWQPFDGLDFLFQESQPFGNPSVMLQTIRNQCYQGDEVAGILGSILNQGAMGYSQLLAEVEQKPPPPKGEWVSTFAAYSTDLPEGADTFDAELAVSYPGHRQSRTAVQGVLSVARGAAGEATLGEAHSYDFVLTGEVLAGDQLFDSFRYKFDFPSSDLGGETIPIVFQRYLRPGSYTLVIKLEDLNAKRFFRSEQPLAVPEVAGTPPPPPDPETARLLAEANAAITSGEVTLKIVPPVGELLTGMHRIDTLVTGGGIDHVTFTIEGRAVLTKTRPPYSVELDLGELPRPRVVAATAYDAKDQELASDEVLVNATSHRFSVRLVEPRPGARYSGSLRARAEVETPDDQPVARVELFLNEQRVATLYQPPYEQPIVLPAGEPVAYVQAVAYLPDGSSTEDLVFVNAPDVLEQMKVQFVELYTSVFDRQGHPVTDLARDDFRVAEDGTPQEIRRFDRVTNLPIHAAVLMDVSASMEGRLDATRDAALKFFQQIITPKDRAAVITFNDRPYLAVKFTNDLVQLGGGLAGLKAERGTALYDSLVFSLYYFNGITGQRAMLVLSDGKDESSRFSFDDALEYARRAGVTIYSIGLDLPHSDARRKLTRLAEETGGRSFFIDDPTQLGPIYAAINEELRSQYLLAYQSTNTSTADAFRFVDLKLDRPGLEAKTIRGYYP